MLSHYTPPMFIYKASQVGLPSLLVSLNVYFLCPEIVLGSGFWWEGAVKQPCVQDLWTAGFSSTSNKS